MKLVLFELGSFKVYGYGFMIGIGFLLAMFLAEFRAKKMGMKDDPIFSVAILAGVFGFIGAKLLYVIVEWKTFLSNPMEVLSSSGFVVYGGIIIGTLVCGLYIKKIKESFLEYFDLVMPSIALAQAFGRLGCLCAGCCYGAETTGPFYIVFPADSMAPAGVHLIPTQIISSVADFVNMLVLIIIARFFSYSAVKHRGELDTKKHFNRGTIGFLYMIFYSIGRFIIEYFRDDYRGSVGSLSTSQTISIVTLVVAVVLMLSLRVIYSDKKKEETVDE